MIKMHEEEYIDHSTTNSPADEQDYCKEKYQRRIDQLEAENARLAKMFAEDVYIESAYMSPEHYNLSLRGKGAMLVIGQLIHIFRESGGKNFLTNTLVMTLPDNKTQECFELTIQKVEGKDSPAQKIERQVKQIEALKTALIEEKKNILVLTGLDPYHPERYKLKDITRWTGWTLIEKEAKKQLAHEFPDIFGEE